MHPSFIFVDATPPQDTYKLGHFSWPAETKTIPTLENFLDPAPHNITKVHEAGRKRLASGRRARLDEAFEQIKELKINPLKEDFIIDNDGGHTHTHTLTSATICAHASRTFVGARRLGE